MLYLTLLIGPMLLALWAQLRVKSAFHAASQIPAASGITGAEVASLILQAHNIRNVRIEPTEGFLSDHYDPSAKVLRLSPDNFEGRSVAALGIAAHEAGHAIQDAERYGPLVIRNGIVPLAAVGSNAGILMIFIGMVMGGAAGLAGGGIGFWLMIAGIALFSCVVVFQLVNLPVEFDASARAKRLLKEAGFVQHGEEAAAMNNVLGAAAWTYVAATIGAIATLLYYLLQSGLLGRREE
jgi:hypothetical protein